MEVTITETAVGHAVTFWNAMPDSQQVLSAQSDESQLMTDGSLNFTFTDGWNNRGRARVGPDGRVDLVQTRTAPGNQIGRNYGSYTVSAEDCSASEFDTSRE